LPKGDGNVKDLNKKVAVVTGAGSGIGRALSVCLTKEGCSLVLADVSESGLEQTRSMLGNTGGRVSTHVLDVADRAAVLSVASEAEAYHGQIDLLINNAGVLLCDYLENVSFRDFEWVMGVNFWGAVNCSMAFLPTLKMRPEAHIVTVSSISGLITTPTNGPYAASKSAVQAFTETLCQELESTNVGVSCVLCGGVRTCIFRNAPRFTSATAEMSAEEAICWYENAAKSTPELAAQAIVNGVKKNKRRILVGKDAYVTDLFARIAPSTSNQFAGYLMRNLNKTDPRYWGRLIISMIRPKKKA
jgi:short-subunit dehydrogenase